MPLPLYLINNLARQRGWRPPLPLPPPQPPPWPTEEWRLAEVHVHADGEE
jgi:hypothetical protein